MQSRIIKYLLPIVITTSNLLLPANPIHITMLVYMDSSDQLSDMAIKNLNDMAAAGSNEHVTIVAQLHAYGDTAYRYKIERNAILQIEQVNLLAD